MIYVILISCFFTFYVWPMIFMERLKARFPQKPTLFDYEPGEIREWRRQYEMAVFKGFAVGFAQTILFLLLAWLLGWIVPSWAGN